MVNQNTVNSIEKSAHIMDSGGCAGPWRVPMPGGSRIGVFVECVSERVFYTVYTHGLSS